MMVSQRVADALLKKLKAEEHYDEVMNIALRNTYDKIYLVGGKVYRGLAELIHERDMEFKDCDWDILVMGKPKRQWLPTLTAPPNGKIPQKGWKFIRSSYNTCYSIKCKLEDWNPRNTGRFGLSKTLTKLDIVSIDDVKAQREGAKGRRGTIDDYWWGVPLDIQAIALDLDTGVISGKGIDAILQKRIEINNKSGTLQGKFYDEHYVSGMLEDKATSMKFEYNSPFRKDGKVECVCYKDDPRMLLYYGCRCGGV